MSLAFVFKRKTMELYFTIVNYDNGIRLGKAFFSGYIMEFDI